MHPGTLRVPSEAGRGASVEAFPRRAWERSSGEALLRQIQIIQHPIHRQLSEHDQLRNPHQRSAQGWLDQSGEFLGDGFGAGKGFLSVCQQAFAFSGGGNGVQACGFWLDCRPWREDL